MISHPLPTRFPLLAYHPPLSFDRHYARSLAEAGALPVFDTEFYSDKNAMDIVRDLEKESFPFAVRVSAGRTLLIEAMEHRQPDNLDLLILSYETRDQLRQIQLSSWKSRLFIEVLDIDLQETLDRLGPHGLILKGYEGPGRVSRYTSFILMQWYLKHTACPLFIHGGVGLYTGAGLLAAGAAGFVLDSQLYLCEEAPLAPAFRELIAGVNETDTMVVGETLGARYRFFGRLGTKILKTLKETESLLTGQTNADTRMAADVENHVVSLSSTDAVSQQSLFYLGQDAAFARNFMASAKGSTRVRDVIREFFRVLGQNLGAVDSHDPMVEDSPLARTHGTRYPVIQGPMANISDNPDFARAVYDNGGLPFFAMGNLPEPLAESMIERGHENVARYGVGLIGIETFNRTIARHFDIVKRYQVPFALFAGGVPAQVNELEAAGVRTYLHTPNMMMLQNAIDGGCTGFIFEGTEAGGHVGSLTSLVLWESAMTVLAAQTDEAIRRQTAIFAGGISTAFASAFISGLSSVLAARGAKIGVQVGTAYLFTREIVDLGGIGRLYQNTVASSRHTLVTGNTVGLASRTVPTPFARKLVEREHRMIKDRLPLAERKTTFETDNLGSLLIGAKGFLPDIHGQRQGEVVHFSEQEQLEKGNFLSGDSLAFLDPGISIADVHRCFFHEKARLFGNLDRMEALWSKAGRMNDDIAVIGAGCILPDAADPSALWDNILSGVYSIRDMPEDRMDGLFYDPDRQAEDRSYTKIAGLVRDFAFDPRRFNMSADEGAALSRTQQMLLHAAEQAVKDAGYHDSKGFDHGRAGRTAVIAASCLGNERGNDLQLKYYTPEIMEHLERLPEYKALSEDQKQSIKNAVKQGVPFGSSGPDHFEGVALHMEAGVIARFIGATGSAYVVDAACATSFAALACAANELLSGQHDTVIVAGVNTNLSPEAFIGFGKMGALSALGSWPFDQRADGFVLGEGAAVFVLKRLKDAVRDKHSIYGVIRGIGSSSDGKGKAIAAPNPAGQSLALTRCFERIKTGITLSDIDYIEAHGTSTIMGDQAEFETLKNVYPSDRPIAISSVKSQIGHLLGGAGAAGLLKALLALRHRTLPPSTGFETLSGNIDPQGTSLYILTQARPWDVKPGQTRKAAVSSYGFGGINFHVVVEEYDPAAPLLPRSLFSDPDHDPNLDRIVFAGLGVVLPGAKNIEELSRLLPGQIPEAVDMPDDRFHLARYTEETDPAFRLPSFKAGIVSDFKFNNVKYKIPPMAARSVERAQLFALDAASQAIDSSGLSRHLGAGNRTGVIIGTPAGRQHAENILRVRAPFLGRLIQNTPGLDDTVKSAVAEGLVASIRTRYPKNTEDTVPGFLSNIVSGRIANFFGCNGANFIVDAGDASSAVALQISALALRSGDMDYALSGGVDTNLYPCSIMASRQAGLFDTQDFNGVISEGAALMVMTTLRAAREHNLPILGEYLAAEFSFDPCRREFKLPLKQSLETPETLLARAAVSQNQARQTRTPAWNFGSLRYAATAVDLAQNLIVKNENPMSVTLLRSHAPGGLCGIQILGSLPRHLSGRRAIPAPVKTEVKPSAASGKDQVVALLSGQGAQSSGMMKEIYHAEPSVKALMDRGEALFRAARGHSLLELMFGDDPALNLTENTQPAVFLGTAAIYDLLKSRGFSPDAVIGHSVGEFSALYCLGLLGFDEAMNLILTRSSLMKQAADQIPGKIMVVFAGADETESLIRESGLTVYVANKNSDRQTAVSGQAKDIEDFCAFLSDKGQMFTRLTLSGAFHTPLFQHAATELEKNLAGLTFNTAQAGRIIANVNAEPYPADQDAIRNRLIRQITSPVEFIRSVKRTFQPGRTCFVEIGPNRLLANLLRNMGLPDVKEYASVNAKKGQLASFRTFLDDLASVSIIRNPEKTASLPPENIHKAEEQAFDEKEFDMNFNGNGEDDFSAFIRNNEDHLKKTLYNEYLKHKKQQAFDALEKFDFNPGKIVVSGVSVGLPGTGKAVFDPDNFTKLLAGTSFIDPLPLSTKEKMVDKNVTKLHKSPDGNARFVEITSTDDVIQLAGQLGYFDLDKEYGIKKQYDTCIALAMAAGIEALKDAHIPLTMQYKQTSTGSLMADGYALPVEMQHGTGVILSSLWPYSETLIQEMTRYFYNKFYVKPYEELEKIYYHIIESVKDQDVKEQVTEWFFKIRERKKVYWEYKLTRDFAHNVTPLGSAHFAQYIRAKGPNIQMSGACASTTQAIGIAEDWIRAGRCDRVIVLGAETPTSEGQGQWIGAGFLSLGAASVEKNVADAAKPFDAARNGTILGSGAVSMIVEREEAVKRRGMNGQAEILGTYIGNTAYHTYNIDVKGIASEMKRFVGKVEKRQGLKKEEYSKKLVFMSHETFTPARGGSADAEITALRATYPDTYTDIVISNTKGYTGHTLGAAMEDAVLVKVLQTGTAPPIANLKDIEDNFKDLKLATEPVKGDFQYGFHIAAGFGSHLAFAFFKRIEENTPENNPRYQSWLKAVTGSTAPKLTEFNHTLMAEAGGERIVLGKAAKPVIQSPGPVQGLTLDTAELPVKQAKPVQMTPVSLDHPDVVDVPVSAPSKNAVSVDFMETVKQTIAEQTGYTVDMLEPDLDLEADLGIDTVKQVEIFGKISAQYNLKVPENLKLKDLNTIGKLTDYLKTKVDPALLQPGPAAVEEVKQTAVIVPAAAPASSILSDIKQVIAAQTGYDLDMLDENLDLEADLGIDTVKQVEIFGKISAQYKLKVPENLKLKDLNTIGKLVAYMETRVDRALIAPAPAAEPAKPEPVSVPVAVPASSILSDIKQVIAAQTGYETDMLDENLDLEADLGIDTVKQVEIFGKISAQYNLKVPENLKLKDLNTIGKLAAYMETRVDRSLIAPPPIAESVKPEPASVPVAAPASSILSDIKQVIAAQTGYETDMLDENLDLEADLGIDTVKQVEIFGKISAQYKLKVPENLKLKDLNTIGKLVAYMETRVTVSKPAESPVQRTEQALPAAEPVRSTEASGVRRFVLSVRKAEPSTITVNRFEKSCILVTLDSHGFAEAVCREIRKRGGSVITLGKQNSADIRIDLNQPEALESALPVDGSLRTITGLIHLAPLDHYLATPKAFDFLSKKTTVADTLNLAVKSLFVMVKTLKNVLDRPGALIAGLTFNSVVFPYMDGFKGAIHPAFAGLSGFLKTVNKEYPDTLVRLVDFCENTPKTRVNDLARTFVDELSSDDRRVEKGYMNTTPYVLRMAEKPPAADSQLIRKGDTILVTGGAQGITYEIIRKTALAYQTDLIILGRSDVNGLDSHFLLPTVDEKMVLARMKAEMKNAKPLSIKRAADKIMRTREAALNIRRLEAEGIRVTYERADVTDAAVVEQIVRRHRNISGVIHAAGVEESQFIEKKDLASVSRVMDVKVKGLDNLLKALKDRPCRYLIAFSSVTARFGNEGQCDYTAANDMIGKMLMKEKQERPDRQVKVYSWTAWSGAGMAENETVKKVLESRGITFLPLDEGVDFFLRDLVNGTDTEVVIAGPDTMADLDGILALQNPKPPASEQGMRTPVQSWPFLDNRHERPDSFTRFTRTLSLDRDLFLFDHSMEGTPIFLGATGIETMAEGAHSLHGEPGAVFRELRDFSIPYGIKILKGRPKEIVIDVEASGASLDCSCSCRITSVFTNPKGQVVGEPTVHYQGQFILDSAYAPAERMVLPEFKKPRYTGDAESLIYHPQRLFMDDLFKTLKDVLSFNDGLMVTEFADTSDKPFFKGITSPVFLTDVTAVDAMFQTGGLLEFFTSNNLVLPYKIKTMTVHGRIEKGRSYLCFTRKTAEDDETCTFQLQLTDRTGNLLIRIEDFSMVKLAKLDETYRITDRLLP